ncbi:MAG: solute carrier family 23 protein, partial [Spirochaetaceae bacterium]|nr:solute carrier family 23 protein [Spirochaetaceae bacterium]
MAKDAKVEKGFWQALGFRRGNDVNGLLPDEAPSIGKLVLFALQQFIVMFPATVLVALLTGFHVSTTVFASGFATLGFIAVTRGKIPLYYGSSFSYLAAVMSITMVKFGERAPDALISQAQFGIIMSGLVSMLVGFLVLKIGMERINKVLPAPVTGSIAIVIGIALAGTALTQAAGNWTISLITLAATIIFSVVLKGVWGQLPILFGVLVGYVVSWITGMIDFSPVANAAMIELPHFTVPTVSWSAVLAIMPIA